MQLIAFLKDSYREARSGWVLQTMLVLLLLVILVVGSISFQPVSAPDAVGQQFRIMERALNWSPEFKSVKFAVENPTVGNPAEPWNGAHDFDVVISAGSAEQLKKIKDDGGLPTSTGSIAGMVKEASRVLKQIKVTALPAADDKSLRFHVASAATTAADISAWPHVPTILFGIEAPLLTMSLREAVYAVEHYIMTGVGAWVLLFISVVISAAFLPNLLQKGAFDLIVTKPIPRWRLLLYKYLGGLVFIGVLTTFAVGGSYLAISLRSGIWNHNFLLAIPIILAYFAVLYSVSVVAAVMTRSTIVAILVTLLAWLLFYAVGKLNGKIEDRAASANTELKMPTSPEDIDPDAIMAKLDPDSPIWGVVPKSLFGTVKALATVLPRTYQMDDRLSRVIAEGTLTPAELKKAKLDTVYPHSWLEVLGVSFAFIAVVLLIGSWRLNGRDG